MSLAGYIDDYAALESGLPGKNLLWLTAQRQAALAAFSAGGFPSPRAEEWKYTNVAAIEKARFQSAAQPAGTTAAPAALEASRLADAWSIVLLDGRVDFALSRLEGLPSGVAVTGLAQALEQSPQRVEAVLGKALPVQLVHGFIHFNTAWFTDGVWIDVPPGAKLDKPVQIIHATTQADRLAATRSLIVLGANAEAQVAETFANGGEHSSLTAAITEVHLAENASLTHYKCQAESGKAFHFGGLYAQQARDARFIQHNLGFGALLARNEIHADLARGAECELNGLFWPGNVNISITIR
jgi:Fe-S cluster assembly protein SufD